ncbi:hypothetical protein [Streptomyces sp. NPDC051132]|uniref:hypothetical protein n=1 Tax=unclassified Streptomyces TaxID=2593676 RepID=UPI0034385479
MVCEVWQRQVWHCEVAALDQFDQAPPAGLTRTRIVTLPVSQMRVLEAMAIGPTVERRYTMVRPLPIFTQPPPAWEYASYSTHEARERELVMRACAVMSRQ